MALVLEAEFSFFTSVVLVTVWILSDICIHYPFSKVIMPGYVSSWDMFCVDDQEGIYSIMHRPGAVTENKW